MASLTLLVAAAIFAATYALISLRRIGRRPLDRPATALLGGALMLLFGIVTPAQALLAINLDVILLLLGMMLLVSGLDVSGFFDLVSTRIASWAKTQAAFLFALMAVSALLSALVLNDAIALLMTPIVVRATRSLKVKPVPYLVALAVSANIGSVATEVGNPQNAYIAIQGRIPFLTFSAALLPVTLVCLGLAMGILWFVFRKDLRAPLERTATLPPVRLQRDGLAFSLSVIVAVVAGFLLSPTPAFLPLVALVGGALVLFVVPMVTSASARRMVGEVDWTIILFFVGLFVLLGGVEASGLSAAMESGFTAAAGGSSGGALWITGLSAILSNLISNVPAVLLLAQFVPGMQNPTQIWLALAASSTLAGNATILGAACNVIVVQIASRDGVEVSMKDFVKAGLPITLVTLAVAAAMIAVLA